MEFIIIYIIAALILCMLTGSIFYLAFAVLTIFIGFVCLISLFFLFSVGKLLRSRPKTGDFVRVAAVKENALKIGKGIKYKVAVYSIGGREYESVFPAEGLFGVYFYPKTKNCRLWLYERDEKVFDGYNVASCIVWPIFCIFFLTAAFFLLFQLVRMRYML